MTRIHSTKNSPALQSLFQKIFPVFLHIFSPFLSVSCTAFAVPAAAPANRG